MDRFNPNNNGNNWPRLPHQSMPMSRTPPSAQHSSNQSSPGQNASSRSSWSPGSPPGSQNQYLQNGPQFQQTPAIPHNNVQNRPHFQQASAIPQNNLQNNPQYQQQAHATPQNNLQSHGQNQQVRATPPNNGPRNPQNAQSQMGGSRAMHGRPSTPQRPPQSGGSPDPWAQLRAQERQSLQSSIRPRNPQNGQSQIGGSAARRGTPSTPQGPSQPGGDPNLSVQAQAQPQARNRRQSRRGPLPTVRPDGEELGSVDFWRRLANEHRRWEADNPGTQMNPSSQPSRHRSRASLYTQRHTNSPESQSQSRYALHRFRNRETGMVDAIMTVSVDHNLGTRIERHIQGRRQSRFEPMVPWRYRDSRVRNGSVYDPALGDLDSEERERARWSPVTARRDLPRGPMGPEQFR